MSIQVQNISKSYKTTWPSVSFDVKEGEIFGLIGPDGAGKTTIFGY
jgi:ABC-type multidrug transport system ATPase subunit